MARRAYATDVSDAEWLLIEASIPAVKSGGRPALHTRREIINGICYVFRSGGAWRWLPPGALWAFPPWQTVYHYFRLWRDEGVFAHLNHGLREEVRERVGREREPSGAIIDSQSGPEGTPTTEKGDPVATMEGNASTAASAI